MVWVRVIKKCRRLALIFAIIDELDQICQRDRSEVDLKRKILDDLRHLESVVTNKISEIEADLEKLTRK